MSLLVAMEWAGEASADLGSNLRLSSATMLRLRRGRVDGGKEGTAEREEGVLGGSLLEL